ncbi:MAG: ATPase domain-containing protein [Candidatus Verstraetearchaeota archaeon]|nr:ATPase domain-containing protein [Candidatus Verstraetearchaeota archaeon]
MSEEVQQMVRLGTGELDRLIGGIPLPSMNLIEGENDTGKSVFAQDVAWGALMSGFRVRYITTEMTVQSLVSQMESLSFQASPHFIRGEFRVTAFHAKGINWDENIASNYLSVMLNYIKKKGDADVVIFDSLTYIATHSSEKDLLNFLSELRNYVDQRKRIAFVTIHPFAFDSNLLIRIRSICDGHMIFKVKTLPSNETARTLEVLKLRGAAKATNNLCTFKVEPGIGIRVLPFTQVKA